MSTHSKETIREAVTKRYGDIAKHHLQKNAPGSETTDAGCCTPAGAGQQQALETRAAESSATAIAAKPEATSCCSPSEATSAEGAAASSECALPEDWTEQLYAGQDMGGVDEKIAELTLGCGNPIAIAELNAGETVLDLGSGAGLDCFLASKQVGPEGRVIGVDMTPSMLELAERNLKKVDARNVEFRQGYLEDLPVRDGSVDVIISNCVINLAVDKSAVLTEAIRVLRPGGRVRVSDIVWLREPTPKEQSDLASWAGCVAGALTVDRFTELLGNAGFVGIEITPANPESNQGWSSASILARKPW